MEQSWRHTAAAAALLALVLWASGCGSSPEETARRSAFNSKVDRLLVEEPLDPKCFTEWLEDLVCFWETSELPKEGDNQTTYIFGYKFDDETSLNLCNLTVENTPRNTTRYTCIFPRKYVSAFAALEIKIFNERSPSSTLYLRSIWVNKIVFLDSPSNLTVHLMEPPGQLNLSWHPPSFPLMEKQIRYEVIISHVGFKPQKRYVENGQTYLIISGLKSQGWYTLSVRAKPDGISYDGYWSAQSKAVTVEMPGGSDPLILTLSILLVLIVLLLAFIALMSNRRFLKKKIWPAIPTPEHEFKDLFTIYKGNFQLWLGHQSAYLWWSQNPPYLDEQPFLVEILSECDSRKVDGPPPPLPPKAWGLAELPPSPELSQDDYLVLDEDFVPCSPGEIAPLLLLNSDNSEGKNLALAEGTGTPEPSQASSGFEYTVFDPSSESLSPQNQQTELPQLKSSYQMTSDSGISADYTPVGSSACPTSLYTNLCEGGLQPQPFLPTYIVCS
ncbi:erythropoietin receptor [Hemicordylus capensis]|uniref:erythropoietin receptor n=1 Tax=Hemicordylus capensis TaxID=884348 RepID=UPI002302B0C8|nr:erythropoietin receptor [Hemicordylus capensis]